MEFKRFTSMIHHSDFKKILSANYLVTEKLDGANFAFWYNGSELKVSSRNEFTDGTFYNCKLVIDLYRDKIIDFYKREVKEGLFVLRGELVGQGILNRVKYPHQVGNRSFYAFEAFYLGKTHNALEIHESSLDIPTVPIIGLMSLGEAMGFESEFNSILLNEEGNLAEGIVIIPSEPIYIKDSRVIIKNVSKKFKEIVKPRTRIIQDFTLSDQDQAVFDELREYINESRLYSVLSKHGEFKKEDFRIVMHSMVQDAIEEYPNEFLMNTKQIEKLLNKEASKLIKEILF